MIGLTNQQLLQEIATWMNSRVATLPEFGQPFFSQGGWEGWVQVELAMYLTSRGYDVMREDRIYGNSFRADLVVNPNIVEFRNIAVEIKCQSMYRSIDSQLPLYDNDIERLLSLGLNWNGIMLIFVVEPILMNKLLSLGYMSYVTRNLTLCYKEIISLE
ncbi:hypothetical protein [Phocaeicola coprocola]|uniref:hypothetical protein n=1 Tax=Phocaeicola coprocola TaxID=310298 RepID=UPI0032BF95C9